MDKILMKQTCHIPEASDVEESEQLQTPTYLYF